jgi:hypothetical protein
LADIGCDIPSLRDRAPCQLKTHLFALNLLFFSTLTLRLTRMGTHKTVNPKADRL